jgi:hypothetical protein
MKTRAMIPFILLSALVLAPATTFYGLTTEQAPQVQVKPQVELKKLPAFPPTITSATSSIHVMPVPLIDVKGRGFGDVQGAKRILIDGNPALLNNVLAWTDKSISFEPPIFPFVAWYHEYTFVIDDGAGKILSNQFKARFLVFWVNAFEGSSAPGGETGIRCYDAGADRGSKVLKMDGQDMEILSWTDEGRSGIRIRARIPAIAPGWHKVYLMDGANKISGDLNFQVR